MTTFDPIFQLNHSAMIDPSAKKFCYFHPYFMWRKTNNNCFLFHWWRCLLWCRWKGGCHDENDELDGGQDENDHLDGGQDDEDHLDEGHLSPVLANDGLQGADSETAKDFRNLKFKFKIKCRYLYKSSTDENMFMGCFNFPLQRLLSAHIRDKFRDFQRI